MSQVSIFPRLAAPEPAVTEHEPCQRYRAAWKTAPLLEFPPSSVQLTQRGLSALGYSFLLAELESVAARTFWLSPSGDNE